MTLGLRVADQGGGGLLERIIDRSSEAALVDARRRLAGGDAAGALDAIQPELGTASPPDEVRILAARALRALGRHADAVLHLTAVAARSPDNAIVAHNLAAAAGDAGDHRVSAIAARRAVALRDAPESWLVLGRALQTLGDLTGAREALAGAIIRRPGYAEALRGLSQLIWMTTGDAAAALQPLQEALKSHPSPDLAALTCGILKDIAGPASALNFIRNWTGKGSVSVELAAAAAAEWIDAGWHFSHAQAAITLGPDLAEAQNAWAIARLARGDVKAVLRDIERRLARAPSDQIALGLQRTAWRLAGRPEALGPADYARLARTWDIEPLVGWTSRAAWLDDLSVALRRIHSFQAQPFGQSVRGGAQSRMDPRRAGEPVIDAAFAAFAAPLADYLRTTGLTRKGATAEAVISGAWSVRLTSGGRHSDHVHPQGRISSAFYVSVPEPAASEPFGGWLRFGALHLGPALELPAEHRIEPKPGRLALFPSYLWHGTEPFSGDGERLTIAFDAQISG